MKYANTYFGKEIEELNYENIVDFFVSEKEESDKIEFKAYSTQYGNFNKNLEGVIRGICALLNSEGGIIIWGAPEGVKIEGKDEKVFKGELSPVNSLLEKDKLISKLSDSITPLPVGIKAAILGKGNMYVYVFEIQKSDYKPHQYKNTYWTRLDGQTKPAPHYLIESLFKQIKYPNLEGYIKPTRIDHDGTHIYLDINIFIFNFSHFQNEEKVFLRLMSSKGIFTRSKIARFQEMYEYEGHYLNLKDFADILHYGSPHIHLEKLEFSPYENDAELILMFGGKKSPLKTSRYKLDITKMDVSRKDNPNYIFTEIVENKINAEVDLEMGESKEEKLRRILER